MVNGPGLDPPESPGRLRPELLDRIRLLFVEPPTALTRTPSQAGDEEDDDMDELVLVQLALEKVALEVEIAGSATVADLKAAVEQAGGYAADLQTIRQPGAAGRASTSQQLTFILQLYCSTFSEPIGE